MNINGTKTENADEEMMYIFDKIDAAYFSGGNVDEHTGDYTLEEMNINVSIPTEVKGEATLTGNININTALKALEDVSLFGEVKNTNQSVIFSQFGDIVIDSTNVNLNGLIYAPYGDVNITAQNLNLNNVIIIADTITFNCPSVNANYSSDVAEFVGTKSENEKIIILDTKNLNRCGTNSYSLTSDFIELNGYLGKYSSITNFSCNIYDKNNNLIFKKNIVPSWKWNIEDIGLINGDNKVIFKAVSSDGKEYTYEFNINTNTSQFMNNLMLDKNDDDNDGLWNYFESYFNTDKNIVDTDGDGISDFIEIYVLGTDPTIRDTDMNGIEDGDEDFDGDELSNAYEISTNSDPLNIDTDGDKLNDNEEYEFGTSLIDKDTDIDGISDYDETLLNTDPLKSNDTQGSFTKEFRANEICDNYDYAVIPTIKLTADATGILTFNMERLENNCLLNSNIPGYLGSAYNFTTDGNIENAELTFTYNTEYMLNDNVNNDNFNPTIYYLNEIEGTIEEVDNQIKTNNTVTVKLNHFSTYILINKTDMEAFWNKEIEIPDDFNQNVNRQIVFLLDTSGSMSTNDKNYIRTSLVKEFASRMDENTKIGVVGFDNYPKLYTTSGITNDMNEIDTAIDDFIEYGNPGGTYIYRGLQTAKQILNGTSKDNDNGYNTIQSIFLLTDGNSSDTPTTDFLNQLSNEGISVYTIGLGSASENYLRRISDATNGKYYYARVNTDLQEVFLDFEDDLKYTDTNNDKLDDYYAYLMCMGEMKTVTGLDVLTGIDYDEFQQNDDWDGDGILNGDEISVVIYNDKPYIQFKSDPTVCDTDFDGILDYDEVNVYKTSPRSINYIIDSDDNLFVGNQNNFESGIAANDYLDGNIVGNCMERYFDVLLCGGEMQLKNVSQNIIVDYLLDYSEMQSDDISMSEYTNILYNGLSSYQVGVKYYLNYSGDARTAQNAIKEINAMQKELNTFRRSAQRTTQEGAKLYKQMQQSYRSTQKSLKGLDGKLNKAKLSNSKAGTYAVIIYLTSTVADDIIDCAMLNTNLDLIGSYVDVVDELRDCGISEFERAANDLFEDIQNEQVTAENFAQDLIIDLGTTGSFITFHACLIELGPVGLALEALSIVGSIAIGDNLSIRLKNSMAVTMANCIDLASYDCIYINGDYTSDGNGNVVIIFNQSGEQAIKMMLNSIAAKKYCESKYIEYLEDGKWMIYKTDDSLTNSYANVTLLLDLANKYQRLINSMV